MRKLTTKRTAERLIRAAYDFEALAARMRYEGFTDEGAGVGDIASRLGNIGRALRDKLEGQ